uniref:malonyl-ACP O-methyltransferase BioC n=1 Tax=Thaumasiovibrio occultus TaxID=1891184 RepID=UPI000B3595FF|nr:malonyl-ACP O-methyltransferase BioC [Thaumasiovibrio occultus]
MLSFHSQKQAIASAFGKAASSYDASAAFQRRAGLQLIHDMPHFDLPQKVLDLGCGTGYFSHEWQKAGHKVTCLDLSPAMLAQAQQRCGDQADYLVGDAEHLPLADSSFDVAFSSLALQWCDDLSKPLAEMRRVVRPGGVIAFTTLVDGSLEELASAWRKIDEYQHINQFLSEKLIKIALAQAASPDCQLHFRKIVQYYSHAKDLMKDLKGIGATQLQQPRRSGLGGRAVLRKIEEAYDVHRHANGLLPATYHVCFGVIINE